MEKKPSKKGEKMPHKPARFLKHPDRKLRAVPRKQAPALIREHGLPGNSRFYYDMKGNMFCTYLWQPESDWIKNNWEIFVKRVSSRGNKLLATGYIRISHSEKLVEIQSMQKVGESNANTEGQMVFRALLNETLRFAKAKKSAGIEILATNQKLASYYSGFGFVFNDPEKPLMGKLTLQKRRSAK